MRAQKEVKNLLIETGRKGIPGTWWTESLAKLCPAVMCEAEQVSDELVYLAKVSRQKVEGTAWFLVAADSKMLEEKDGRAVQQKGTGT